MLDKMFPGEFQYKASWGVGFRHRSGAYVELTTYGQVDAHVARGGNYANASYVAYNLALAGGYR